MASQKIRGITIELNADTAGILDGIKELNKSLSTTDKALRDVDKLLKFDPGNTTLVAQQQEYLAKAIDDTKLKLEEEKKLLETMKSSDNASETVEQQKALAREIESTTQKLNKYESELKQTDSSIDDVKDSTEQAKTSTSTFGEILKAKLTSEAIIQGVRMLADGIKDIATSAFEVGTAFESSMSQVAATMGMTSEDVQNNVAEYKLLSDTAKEMGKATKYSASEAADALNYLALAGYDAEKAAATLPQVLTLAAAGDMELAYASDLVTDAMSALGMSTDDVQTYIDQMAKTSQKANTNVSQLGEATLVTAGTVALTGQSLETMNTELGILADNGLKGAEGGTHLRNILLSLSAPTDKAAAKLEELGIIVGDSDGNMRDLNDIMIDLNASLGDLGSVEKTAAIKAIFNKTDIGAVNALLKDSGERFTELNSQIKNANGAAKAMADTMIDNLKGKVTILQSALEGLGISFYEIFDQDAKDAVDTATDAVGQLQKAIESGNLGVSLERLSDSFGDLADRMIDWAMDVLPDIIDGASWFIDNLPEIVNLIEMVAGGYLAYETACTIATIAQQGLNTAIEANPIGLLASAAVVAGLAIKDLFDEVNNLSEETMSMAKSSQRLADNSYYLSDSSKTLVKDLSSEEGYISSLASELETLQGKEKLTNDERKRASEIVRQLNSKIEGLNLVIDSQTGKLTGATDGWKAYIDAQLEMARVDAVTDKIKEIGEQILDNDIAIYEAEQKLNDAQLEWARNEEYYDALQNKLELTEADCEELERTQEVVQSLSEDQMAAVQVIRNLTDANADLTAQQEVLNGFMGDADTVTEQAAEATQQYAEATAEAQEETRGLSEICEELEIDYGELKEKAIDSLESQRDQFEKMGEEASKSVDEIATSFEKQAENMAKWAEDIAAAQEVMQQAPDSEGLLDYYISQGPAAAGEIEKLIEAFYAGGDALKDFEDAVVAFNETQELIDQLSDLNVAIETGSSEAVQIALEQLDVDLPAMEEKYRTSWETTEADADTHRTNMTETATGTVTDMADAITTNAPLVSTATKTMMETAVHDAKTAIGMSEDSGRSTVFYDLGRNIDQSIADGVTDNASVIATALQGALDSAVNGLSMEGLSGIINSALGEALGK